MPTPYITRIDLEQLFGSAFITDAEDDTGARVASVIDAANAEADTYVLQALAEPVHEKAVLQCRWAVAWLAVGMLYMQVLSDSQRASIKDARVFLQRVADGKAVLYSPPLPEDEGDPAASGEAAFGAAPRTTKPGQTWMF